MGLPIDTPPVLGIALDGLGYGADDTLWGGEFLVADYRAFQRVAHFEPMAMLGGAQATRQPWRNTYAQLVHSPRMGRSDGTVWGLWSWCSSLLLSPETFLTKC